jgi:hypothetical protein
LKRNVSSMNKTMTPAKRRAMKQEEEREQEREQERKRKCELVKAVVATKVLPRGMEAFKDGDFEKLDSARFITPGAFKDTTEHLLMSALPLRPGLVGLLLQAFIGMVSFICFILCLFNFLQATPNTPNTMGHCNYESPRQY